jgi:hypothetical protein
MKSYRRGFSVCQFFAAHKSQALSGSVSGLEAIVPCHSEEAALNLRRRRVRVVTDTIPYAQRYPDILAPVQTILRTLEVIPDHYREWRCPDKRISSDALPAGSHQTTV